MYLKLAIFVIACSAIGISGATAQSAEDLLKSMLQQGLGAKIGKARAGSAPRVPTANPRSPEIARIQTLLNSAGYPAGPPDGIAGRGTINAIMAFQRSLGNPATGALTPNEMRALEARAAGNGGRKATAEPVDQRKVQSLLSELGYDVGVVDGQWGPRSQRALDAFRSTEQSDLAGRPSAKDVALLKAAASPASEPMAEPGPVLTFRTDNARGDSLFSLPIVDNGANFQIAWASSESPPRQVSIVPVGPGDGGPADTWPFGNTSTINISAPQVPGSYEIQWIDRDDGSVRLRRPLVVR